MWQGRVRPRVGGDPASLEMGGDRGRLQLRDSLLGVGGGGDASRQLPPVVEDPRDVLDPAGALRQPQHQLEVLHPVEGRVRSAHRFDERAAGQEQVADVHHAAKQFGRPVGLEERLAPPPAPVDLVFVAVDDVGCGLLVQAADALEQCVGVELVVVVEEGDELALRRRERPVGRRGDPAVLRRSSP